MIRYWDPQEKYKDGFLKEYKHWVLEVSHRQHTLGSFIIFAKRKIENFSDLNEQEADELPIVMKEIEEVIKKLFDPGRFNYLQMGNSLHLLHFHGIPRYKNNIEFAGKTWIDKSWGHPPIWKKTEDQIDLVVKIKDVILKELT